MTVIFSSPHPLVRRGPGRPLMKIHDALAAKFGTDYRKVSPEDLPQLGEADRFGDARGAAFDDMATRWMNDDSVIPVHELTGAPTRGVLLSGGGAGLQQIDFAHSCAWKTVSTWFSSHYEYAARVLAQEYEQAGIRTPPIHPYVKWRAGREQLESDFLILPSVQCASTYPKELQGKIRIAEFGVDASEFKPSKKGGSGSPLRVVFPATNVWRKGLRYVLEAMLPSPPIGLEVVGTGWDGGGYDLAKYGVSFRGWLPDPEMKNVMDACSVYLSASVEEGQALAGLECAASGMALIVTPETGIPITDGKEGLIVASRDPKAIRSALVYLADNPSEVKRMGREARAFAEARPWSKFTDRVVEIIMEAGGR